MTTLTSLVGIADADTHVTEPADLWSSRMAPQWRDDAPRVEVNERGEELWMLRSHPLQRTGKFAMAGWHEYPPLHPMRLADADPASFDPHARIERMDEYGLQAQMLYPNIVAFYLPTLIAFGGYEFATACIRAYNDFISEFAQVSPERLIPLTMLPLWDVAESVREFERCRRAGHRGVLFVSQPERLDKSLPPIWDPSWEPLFGAVQAEELSVNFHIGFGEYTEEELKQRITVAAPDHVRISGVSMMSNARVIADITCKGVCHRFPRLNFVSVESGVSWLPYLAENLDWHWENLGARQECPEMEFPSFYMKRQLLGSFWFERESIQHTAHLMPDNLMFETDFPHGTSLSPGPVSSSEVPRDAAMKSVAGLDEDLAAKLLWSNAARVYHLQPPSRQPN